jgi:hypothetical protein
MSGATAAIETTPSGSLAAAGATGTVVSAISAMDRIVQHPQDQVKTVAQVAAGAVIRQSGIM